MKSLIYSLNPYLDYFEEQTLSPKPLQHSTRTVITIIAVSDNFFEIIRVFVFYNASLITKCYYKYINFSCQNRPTWPDKERMCFYNVHSHRAQSHETLGCSSVILLRPKMGVAPYKNDVRSMQTQQCTHTKLAHINRKVVD